MTARMWHFEPKIDGRSVTTRYEEELIFILLSLQPDWLSWGQKEEVNTEGAEEETKFIRGNPTLAAAARKRLNFYTPFDKCCLSGGKFASKTNGRKNVAAEWAKNIHDIRRQRKHQICFCALKG